MIFYKYSFNVKIISRFFINLFFKTGLCFLIFSFSFFIPQLSNNLNILNALENPSHINNDFIYCFNSSANPAFNNSAENNDKIDITAEAAIIMEYKTGRILWEKNSSGRLFGASTTKMLSTIVVIENIADLNESTKISDTASGRNFSFFTFEKGAEITLMDLLKAALISSHNNATIALAEYVSGSEEEFLKLMNEKAVEIGALNTTFYNTHGLDSNYPGHKTTAFDLALIAGYCLKNELFQEIIKTRRDAITINDETIELYNTNMLLFFDYIEGIKTGFTNNAGHCLVLFSKREGLEIITVVLKSSPGSREADIFKLINWANDNYANEKIIDSNQQYKKIEINETIESETYIYKTNIFAVTYPEKDYTRLTSVKDNIYIKDDFIENTEGIENNNFIASMPVILPVANARNIGSLELFINGIKETEINLTLKDTIDNPYIYLELSKKMDTTVRNSLIYLLSFYFLIFILIIIKTLLSKGKGENLDNKES